MRSNIAAEARAKIVYERLIDFCDDAGSKDALQFLMTREITHMKAFMTALNAMEKPPLSVGLIKPSPNIVDQYFNTSTGTGDQGEKDLLAPWNEGEDVERVDAPAFQELPTRSLARASRAYRWSRPKSPFENGLKGCERRDLSWGCGLQRRASEWPTSRRRLSAIRAI